ncbi:phytanoyl-CoA dioxygenase family protein [Pleurocapsa sp. FMAR1]|uniref:phytanoyl-CoA dioxygenase family protein n=1 Tax=Pleurocapsa sp. FMAR1 TaxID=3040204 RepID=UPI0029C85942|nr:phytanoyl-CoA dioxygenase family protein [Pleurocapsa sp. FMAR1]
MQPNIYYQEHGYVVLRNLIPAQLINQLLEFYAQQIVPSKQPFFRQSTNKYEPNQLNEYGHVKQSFLDIHDYQKYPKFSNLAKEIYCHESIQNALKQITGFDAFNLMQTMLFDKNTETQSHQDWWYLDSIPNGNLTAAWIALENIDERAGRFYVLPKSNHNPDFHSDDANLSHSQWLQRISQYTEKHKDEITAPALNQGDVLFWNSKTIHGALPTINPSFSRKSLTAHYIPSVYEFGNLFTTKNYITYKNYQGVNFYRNQPDYSLLNNFKFKLKTSVYDSPILLKLMRSIQKKISSR